MGVYISIMYFSKKDSNWERTDLLDDNHDRYIYDPNKNYPVYSLLNNCAEEDPYPPDPSYLLKKILDDERFPDYGFEMEKYHFWAYLHKVFEKYESDEYKEHIKDKAENYRKHYKKPDYAEGDQGEEEYHHTKINWYLDAIKKDLLNKYDLKNLIAIWSFS